MDQHDYEGLIRQLESESEHAPAAFRSKVFAISVFAYFGLAILLAASACLIYIGWQWASARHSVRMMIYAGLFALTMLPVFWVSLRFFFMRMEPPSGREITRAEAPKLFEVLDKMRKKRKGPPIHHVLIDREYNAAISQMPRWGLFGGHTNYLMLGLPYLFGVPPKEMLATVAHEYGHLCGDHGKMGAWVYRQRLTFGMLYRQVSESGENNWSHAGLTALLGAFMPYYNAYTFVLSRQQEYEADRTATELVGAEANATGLIRDALQGRWIAEDFWPKFYKLADGHPQPPFLPFASMRTAFGLSYAEWATPARLSAAWREDSNWHDTHPCLRLRVEATGRSASLPPAISLTAAEVLLGGTAKRLTEEFDQAWWKDEKKNWTSRHQYVQRSRQELAELAARPLDSLPLHELQQLALLQAEFNSRDVAKPILEYLLAKPGGPYAKPSFFYGRMLLDEKNDRGLAHLETAANNDRNLVGSVARIGYQYLYNHRGEQAAIEWWQKIVPAEDDE